ncbi:MAG: hypothetical protein FJW88_03420 [Actinobacteria bacterium]|nr:hypothetical protein [Actinomycetota bacterium]
MSTISKSRSARLRAVAVLVLVVGVGLGLVLGVRIGTSTSLAPEGVRIVNYTAVPEGGGTGFNWLFFLLAAGPACIAASILFATAELAHVLGRRSRSQSSRRESDLEGFNELDLT